MRECREELGIEVEPVEHLLTLHHQYEYADLQIECFLCRWSRGCPKPYTSQEVRWVPWNELPNYSFPPANRELLEHLEGLSPSHLR